MKALLRPAFVFGLSIAIAATSLTGSSSVALAANLSKPSITTKSLEGLVYEGGRPFLTGTFTDGTDRDPYTLIVNWGDGTPEEWYSIPNPVDPTAPPTRSFRVQKTEPYANDAVGLLMLITLDDSQNANSKTLSVTVLNAAPAFTSFALSATEIETDQTVTATGQFSDGGANDTHTLTLDWNDGTTPATMSLGTALSFTTEHKYSTARDYTVTATVTDDSEAASLPETRALTVRAKNHLPVLGALQLEPNSVVDHQLLKVSASFTDDDTADTFTFTINWGDGTQSPKESLGTTKLFSATHAYNAAGPVTITATVEDSRGGSDTATEDLVVLPSNRAPTGLAFIATPTGANVVVTGSFTDPDATDTHTVTLNWGDGGATQVVDADGHMFTASHVYATSNTYAVTASVTDHPAGATTDPLSHDVVVTIAPSGLAFDATPTGANVVVTGSFTDPDATDTHTVALDWGDGGATQEVDADGRTFTAPHVYATSNTYTVTASVTDHPAGASTGPVSHEVVVTIAPSGLAFDATSTGASVVVTGSFTDPDATEHTLTVTWGDGGTTLDTLAAGTTTFTSSPHVYAVSNTYTVTATVADAAGQTSATKQVVVTVPATSASDLVDEMSSLVLSFELDRNTERWLLRKLDDLQGSLAYGNGQVCGTGLSHVLSFAARTLSLEQYAALSALAPQLQAAAGCTSIGALQSPKVQKAPAVTTTAAPAPNVQATEAKKDTTTKDAAKSTKADSKATPGRSAH